MSEFESINPERLEAYEAYAREVAAEAERAAYKAIEEQEMLVDAALDIEVSILAEYIIGSLEVDLDLEDVGEEVEEIRHSIELLEQSPVAEAEPILEAGTESIGEEVMEYLELIYDKPHTPRFFSDLLPEEQAFAHHLRRARTPEERRRIVNQYFNDPDSLMD